MNDKRNEKESTIGRLTERYWNNQDMNHKGHKLGQWQAIGMKRSEQKCKILMDKCNRLVTCCMEI